MSNPSDFTPWLRSALVAAEAARRRCAQLRAESEQLRLKLRDSWGQLSNTLNEEPVEVP
jgi:hypothetical protein